MTTKTRLKAIKEATDKVRKDPRTEKMVRQAKQTAKSTIDRIMDAAERHHEMQTTVTRPPKKKTTKKKRKRRTP